MKARWGRLQSHALCVDLGKLQEPAEDVERLRIRMEESRDRCRSAEALGELKRAVEGAGAGFGGKDRELLLAE